MIQVLIVEDSLVQQAQLTRILDTDPDITVLGTATNGEDALSFLAHHQPDVVTLDLMMPQMGGLETTRRIMERYPIPIVIVSAHWDPQEATSTFQAVDAGAVAGVAKPQGVGPDSDDWARQLVQTVKSMAEVKAVRHWTTTQAAVARTSPHQRLTLSGAKTALVAIGASTGGPPALARILAVLPKDFAAPILIVQHIAKGFLQGLADWLRQATAFPVHVPTHGDQIHAGHVYLAPENFHMGIHASGSIILSQEGLDYSVRPSIAYLFRSVATVCASRAIGVLLTGMGRDGAQELKLLKDNGAVTIAQDKDSSVVHGMPGEAIQLGGASHILPPDKIATMLIRLVQTSHIPSASQAPGATTRTNVQKHGLKPERSLLH